MIVRPVLNASVELAIEEKELVPIKCQNIVDQFYAKMKNMVWYCSNCQKINKLDSEPETERKFFESYIDDII